MNDQKEKGHMDKAKPIASTINTVLLLGLVALFTWNLKSTHDAEVTNAVVRETIAAKLGVLDQKLTYMVRNRWTSAHMQIYSDKLEKLNPTVKVPDPLEIQKSYEP